MFVKIPWTKTDNVSKERISKCKEIVSILVDGLDSDDPWYHGSTLALLLKTTTVDIRKCIQVIREHNDKFLVPAAKGYVIASNKGYCISYDRKAIKAFLSKTQAVSTSKLKQIEQGYKTLGMKGW